MPPSSTDPVSSFLATVRQVRSTGLGTAEQSFYPAVSGLLDALGQVGAVKRAALAHPAGIEGNFPDVALYEISSNVLALPIEIKPPAMDIAVLVASAQARDYARIFGGGVVLLTNLRVWVVARLDASGILVEEGRVTIAPSEPSLDTAISLAHNFNRDLLSLIEVACQIRGAITKPLLVAELLAYHARQMRDAIEAAGDPGVLLASIRAAMKNGLEIELEDETMVPTVVQTLVYGLFAAWLGTDDPQDFEWMESAYRLDVPVFAEILHETLRPALVRKCDLTRHLQAVGRVLAWTNRDTFAAAFDGDAIEYFYEPFLAKFDPHLRDALGVWYTPKEIAAYQVARADHHVRHELGITDGLADPSVYLLDPACGTGTYLAAVFRFIYMHHLDNGEPESVAADRAREAATTRLIGFEILPSAFIICHLHLSRFLAHLGAPPTGQRLRVYLTNSLTGWDTQGVPAGVTLFPELEEELRDAAVVKHLDPVLVVLGNPPYQGYSSAETREERQMLAPWVADLWPVWGLRKHRMNDLYVRFWRISIERIVNLTDRGVVSLITNRKWLGGRSYPSMREAVVSSFQSVWVDDLHGATDDTTHPGDQSIFTTAIAAGITRGTAIVTAVRTGPTSGPGQVHLLDYWGTARAKRAGLGARRGGTLSVGYTSINATRASRYRFVNDPAGDFPHVDEYLPTFFSGVQPVRDEAVMDTDRAALVDRMTDYFDPSIQLPSLIATYPGFGVTRAGYDAVRTRGRLLAGSQFDDVNVVKFLFRPFDTRWLYWESEAGLLNRPRPQLLPYWRNVEDQQCLVLPQTPRRKGACRPMAGSAVGGMESAEPNARVFPLYAPPTTLLGEAGGELELVPSDPVSIRETTVAAEWVEIAASVLGTTDRRKAGEAIFFALVTVMNSPTWIDLQPVEMDDFPQVPLPANAAEFTSAVATGRRLTALFDPDTTVHGVTAGQIEHNLRPLGTPDQVAGAVTLDYGTAGRAAGRRDGTSVLWGIGQGWRNVPDDVWNFGAGGHQVLSKWLSYRKVSGLTTQDRETFRLLVRRIQAILDLAPICDAAFSAATASPLIADALPIA